MYYYTRRHFPTYKSFNYRTSNFTRNFTKILVDSPDEVRKYFFDIRIVSVDTISQIPTPPSNCLTTGFENPSLLIYCLIIALIWLGIVATGLFFYFRTIFQKLAKIPITSRDLELQP